MPEETTRSQPRRKSRLITFSVLIFVVIAAGVIYGLFGTSRLNRQLADLRSRGLPTNGEELNAFYAVPPDVRDTTDLWIAATRANTFAKTNPRVQGIPILSSEIRTPLPPPGQEWPELDSSRSFLESLDKEIQLIRDAADAGGWRDIRLISHRVTVPS